MADNAKAEAQVVDTVHQEELNKDFKDDAAVAGEAVDPATRKQEKKLKLKLDIFILSLLSLTYFFASMGRSDLSNAKVAGMDTELQLSAKAYSNAASTFLVGYIVFQLPGTVLLRKIGPPLQFGLAMMTWGLITCLSVLIKNAPTLLALRFLIGMAEAFIQGAVFYLSFWYTYREIATRGAIFFSMSTLAGAFNGLISYGIAKNLEGHNGWHAWRWIFLIEGVMPIAFSFFVLGLLPATPQHIRFGFSKEEKDLIQRRSIRSHNDSEAKLEIKKLPLPLLSIHFWLFVIMACCGHFTASSFSNFLPAIINGFGYSTVDAQLFSVIPYACAFVGIIFWARLADKTNARGLALAISSAVGVLGYALLIGITNTKGRMAATCITAFGVYGNVVLVLSWMTMSIAGYTQRGSATAFVNMFSQAFAIAGNQAYIDAPLYRNGNAASLGLSALCAVVAILTSFYFRWLNAKKKREQYSEAANELRQRSIYDIGDRHPDFFFTS